MREIRAIIIHHTVSPVTTTAEEVTRWHKARGFRTMGYHYLVRLEEDMRTPVIERGRQDHEIGAHLHHQHSTDLGNRNTIGIAIAGNHEEGVPGSRPPSLVLLAQAEELAAQLCCQHGLTEEQVLGHNETGEATACPGSMMAMGSFRGLVRRKIAEILAQSEQEEPHG